MSEPARPGPSTYFLDHPFSRSGCASRPIRRIGVSNRTIPQELRQTKVWIDLIRVQDTDAFHPFGAALKPIAYRLAIFTHAASMSSLCANVESAERSRLFYSSYNVAASIGFALSSCATILNTAGASTGMIKFTVSQKSPRFVHLSSHPKWVAQIWYVMALNSARWPAWMSKGVFNRGCSRGCCCRECRHRSSQASCRGTEEIDRLSRHRQTIGCSVEAKWK